MAKAPAKRKPAAKKPAKKPAAKRAAKSKSPNSLVGHIWAARRDLKGSFQAQMDAGYGEERLLAYIAIACIMAFIATLPSALQNEAFLDDGQIIPMMAAQRFVALVFFAPLFFYGLSAISHVIAVWCFGGQGNYFRARIALFWTMLLSVPLIFIQSIALYAIELTGALGYKGIITWSFSLIWLWIWSTGISVAEGFWRVSTFLFVIMLLVVIFGLSLVIFGA